MRLVELRPAVQFNLKKSTIQAHFWLAQIFPIFCESHLSCRLDGTWIVLHGLCAKWHTNCLSPPLPEGGLDLVTNKRIVLNLPISTTQ